MLAQCHGTPDGASVNLFLKHTSEPYRNRIRRHFLLWLGYSHESQCEWRWGRLTLPMTSWYQPCGT
jgi:hypothetical protein